MRVAKMVAVDLNLQFDMNVRSDSADHHLAELEHHMLCIDLESWDSTEGMLNAMDLEAEDLVGYFLDKLARMTANVMGIEKSMLASGVAERCVSDTLLS